MKRLILSTVMTFFIIDIARLPRAIAQATSHTVETRKASGAPSIVPVLKHPMLRNRHTHLAPPPTPAENIIVKIHRRRSADGVTGLQPGGGLIKPETAAKSVSTVSRDFIQKQSPAQNPLQLVELLPGVVVGSADPFGLTGGTISIRGLDQSEMAMTWEGAPATDIGIYTIDTSEFASNEDLEDVSVQQGSPNSDTPTINGSGGLVSFRDRDPSRKMGGLVALGYGSFNYHREFARFDTGEIGHSGIRTYVSYANQRDNAWRGPGHDSIWNLDWKAIKEWGANNRISLVGAYRHSIENTWPSMTMTDWKTYGRSFTWDRRYAFGSEGENYWRLNRNPYDNMLLSAPSHFTLTDRWHVDFTPYFWHGEGNNSTGAFVNNTNGNFLGNEPLTPVLTLPYAQPASDGTENAMTLMAYRNIQYRGGFTAKTDYRIGNHHDVYLGWWFDYSNDHDSAVLSPVNYNGTPLDIFGTTDNIKLSDGQLLAYQNISTITTVNALFAGDHATFLKGKLVMDAGIKLAMINRNGTNELPGPQYKVVLNDFQPLPALSMRYQFNKRHQIFASVSTSFRSPSTPTLYDAYYGQGISYQGVKNPKDEYSISEEIGYRYNGPILVASATYFHYNFTNRQIQSAVTGTNGGVTVDLNAGGQNSNGVSVELGTRPINHFRPYLSGQYLHATIDNNISGLPTAGMTAVRSPRWTGALGVDWDNGTFFWNYNIRYVSHQYSTLINDEYMPAYYDMNAAIGARLPSYGPLKSSTIQVNFINLTNNHYLSGIQTVTTNATTTHGVTGTAPDYLVAPGLAVIATLKAGF
ncbi:TonB-dependent receptor [Gluconobacter frateurii]|nr:TonB-dependent receptor [Gluconobacter frateurii]